MGKVFVGAEMASTGRSRIGVPGFLPVKGLSLPSGIMSRRQILPLNFCGSGKASFLPVIPVSIPMTEGRIMETGWLRIG